MEYINLWDVCGKVLARAAGAIVRRGEGCLVLVLACSRQLPWPHHRAQLSPAASGRHLGESSSEKGQNSEEKKFEKQP